MISRRDSGYLAAADILRVVGIALVAWFHLWQQSWLNPNFTLGTVYVDVQRVIRRGYLGVDLLLLLSGFLLYLPWAKASLNRCLRPDTAEFYHKRMFRILPSYLLAVAVAFFFALFTGPEAGSAPLGWDLLAHLTMTHTFWRGTYIWSSLNVALWTLAVEAQFYLLFPWLAVRFLRRPGLTFGGMVLLALVCRCLLFPLSDITMLFNQLPCFLDVYALGMLAAHLSVRTTQRPSPFFPLLSGISLFAIFWVLWMQEKIPSLDIPHHQILWRLPLAVPGAVFLYAGTRWPQSLSRVLGNQGIRFLSAISYNFYIWHQYLAVKLKRWHIPDYATQMPQRDEGEQWRRAYFWISVLAALLLAAALTYLWEKPLYRTLFRRYQKKKSASP